MSVELRSVAELRDALTSMVDAMLVEQPDLDPEIRSALVPEPSGYSAEDIEELERCWGRALPAGLLNVMRTFELGGIELAGVTFGDRGTFLESLLSQAGSGRGHLRIATSSAYELVVDENGKVRAHVIDQRGGRGVVVAQNPELLLRALASLALTAGDVPTEDVAKISDAIGAEDHRFWLEVAQGAV